MLWKQTPKFEDTFVTYAHFAGHAVNMVAVENFDNFLNSLCEPSQKDSQFIEVFAFIFIYFTKYVDITNLLFVLCLTGQIGSR